MLKIAFPEFNQPTIQQALQLYAERVNRGDLSLFNHQPLPPIEFLPATSLTAACVMVSSGQADTLIAGLDYSTRDVILACRDHFPMTSKTFSGLAVMHRDSEIYLLADMAACKHPTPAQLRDIIEQTYLSATKLFPDPPRIALLSFSTNGSGGKDPAIDLIRETLATFADRNLLIAGEMQLDAAINPKIGQKKFPNSKIAGHANVLIAPDLNSGNLLYKSFEQIGGFAVAGPILQGFTPIVSDLSRGSTAADVLWTIEVMANLLQP